MGAEGRKARPVLQVDFGGAVQGGIGGEEGVVRADELGVEESC